MTTTLALLERLVADAHERATDPDLPVVPVDGVLRAVYAALATPPSTMAGEELAANRAMLREGAAADRAGSF